MVLLVRREVPGLTMTTTCEGPLLPATGSPTKPSVEATEAPLVMEPAEVITMPVTVMSGAEFPDVTAAPE